MVVPDVSTAARGRPRSSRTHAVVCDAVLDLVRSGATLSSLSLVSIAQNTGISRNSIYRRWKTKEQLYSDVVKSMRCQAPDLTEQSARENVNVVMKTLAGVTARSNGRMERAILFEASHFPELHEQYLLEVVAPMGHAVKSAIRRGKETGEIRADVDENLLTEVLLTTVIFAMPSNDGTDADVEEMSRRTIDLVFDGVSPL